MTCRPRSAHPGPGLRAVVTAIGISGALGFGALITGCGVRPGSDSFNEIPPAEIPFGLDQTSTSSSTTTTTTVLEAPQTTPTTVSPVRQETVEIYFLSRGRLQPTYVELPAEPSANQIADLLEEGPPPNVALDSLIEDGLIASTSEAGGILTVDLNSEVYDRIPSTQQTEAIAQIVMSMITSLRLVGLVTFTLDGEPIAVKMGDSLLSEVGQALSYDDYAVLLARSPTPTNTTTTVAPTTTVPADVAPATAPAG